MERRAVTGRKRYSSGKGLALKSSQKVEESAENNLLQRKSASQGFQTTWKPGAVGRTEGWGPRSWKPEAAAETNVHLQLCWLASYQLNTVILEEEAPTVEMPSSADWPEGKPVLNFLD